MENNSKVQKILQNQEIIEEPIPSRDALFDLFECDFNESFSQLSFEQQIKIADSLMQYSLSY